MTSDCALPLAENPQETLRTLDELSVIVPVGPEEAAWRRLLADFRPLPERAEVVMVGVAREPPELAQIVTENGLRCSVHWLESLSGRAAQLNHGAATARGSFLWFVHADSRLDAGAVDALASALSRSPQALHYFDLAFAADGPRLTWLNVRGANLRARWLGLPFGDQGLCMSVAQFDRLGGFDEHAQYGEDHLLVWKAHRLGIDVRAVGARIVTSARNYEQRGWLPATLRNLWRTARQAIPQFIQLIADRRRRKL